MIDLLNRLGCAMGGTCSYRITIRLSGCSGLCGFSVAVEDACAELQKGGGAGPELRVGEEAGGDGETAGPVEVGGDAPQSQHRRQSRGRGEQAGSSQREPLVPPGFLSHLGACAKPDPKHHGCFDTNLTALLAWPILAAAALGFSLPRPAISHPRFSFLLYHHF